MKTVALTSLLLTAAFAGSLSAQSTPPGAISFWKTGVATENAREIRVPDRAGPSDAVVPANCGVKIVEEKDVDGGKAVEFSGAGLSLKPEGSLRTTQNVEIKDSVYAEMMAKPEMTPHDQALMYYYGVLEFRAKPQRGEIEMVVWYPGAESKVATSLRAPLKIGRWNKISGSIEGSKIMFKVNGSVVRGVLPDDAVLLPIKAPVFFGAGAGRPAVGRIANMAICKKAP